METCNKSKLTMQEKKTIQEYCEDIIQARYYDLSKLKELNIVKAVYDENNIVRISVDPALTPSQNAQKLYKDYHKACTAENMLINNDTSRKKRKKVIDSLAATIILQSYLDKNK